jgi:hypothetical protein
VPSDGFAERLRAVTGHIPQAAGGQDVQPRAENNDHNQAEPESGHGVADDRDKAHHLVDPRLVVDRRQHA